MPIEGIALLRMGNTELCSVCALVRSTYRCHGDDSPPHAVRDAAKVIRLFVPLQKVDDCCKKHHHEGHENNEQAQFAWTGLQRVHQDLKHVGQPEELEDTQDFQQDQHLEERHLFKLRVKVEQIHENHRREVRPRVGVLQEGNLIWREDDSQEEVEREPNQGGQVNLGQYSIAKRRMVLEVIQRCQRELDEICGEGEEGNNAYGLQFEIQQRQKY